MSGDDSMTPLTAWQQPSIDRAHRADRLAAERAAGVTPMRRRGRKSGDPRADRDRQAARDARRASEQ